VFVLKETLLFVLPSLVLFGNYRIRKPLGEGKNSNLILEEKLEITEI
jgi:hypothetical protein